MLHNIGEAFFVALSHVTNLSLHVEMITEGIRILIIVSYHSYSKHDDIACQYLHVGSTSGVLLWQPTVLRVHSKRQERLQPVMQLVVSEYNHQQWTAQQQPSGGAIPHHSYYHKRCWTDSINEQLIRRYSYSMNIIISMIMNIVISCRASS